MFQLLEKCKKEVIFIYIKKKFTEINFKYSIK